MLSQLSHNNINFSDLLKYLEQEQEKHKNIQPAPKDKIQKLENIFHYDNPLYDTNFKVSKGFDVDKFKSLMKSKLINSHQKSQNYVRPFISVSEVLYCLRQAYYKRLNYQIDLDKCYSYSFLDLINEVGNSVHDYIQDLYGFDEVEKTIICEEYKIKGRIDAIKGNCLIEFKTIDPSKFKNNYVEVHYNQCLLYSHILNNYYNYNIDTITIVYIIRTLNKIIPFDLPIDPEKSIKFLKQSLYLKKCIDSKEIPNTINSTSEQCKYCSYKKYCDKDNIELIKSKEKNQKHISLL